MDLMEPSDPGPNQPNHTVGDRNGASRSRRLSFLVAYGVRSKAGPNTALIRNLSRFNSFGFGFLRRFFFILALS